MNLEIRLDTQSKDGTLTPEKIAATGTFVFPSLEISATDKAFALPRLTTVERDAISPFVTGSQIYNTDTNEIEVYNGTMWTTIAGGGGSATFYNDQFTYSGSNIFTLTAAPSTNSEVVSQNGLLLHPTSGYTISGTSLTVLTSLTGGDTIQVTYATGVGGGGSVTFGDDIYTIAGSNILALSNTPIAGSEVIVQNGLVLRPTDGYTITGTTLTMVSVVDGDIIQAKYQISGGGGGGGTPAGATTQIQFNNAGAFGASAGLTYDETGFARLTVGPNPSNLGTEILMRADGNNFLSLSNAAGTTEYAVIEAGPDTGGTLRIIGSASNLSLESTNGDIAFTVGSGGKFRSADANFSYNVDVQTLTVPNIITNQINDNGLGLNIFAAVGSSILLKAGALAGIEIDENVVGLGRPMFFDTLDTASRDALTPSSSWMIYNTTTLQPEYYNGTSWISMAGGGGGSPAGLNGDIQFNNAGAFGNAPDGDGQGYLRWDNGASTLRTYKLDVDAPDLANATLFTVHSSGPNNNGTNNYEIGQTSGSTSNATPAVVWSMALDDDTVYSMEMRVVARDTVTGDAAQIILRGCYKRVAGGNVVQVGATDKLSNQDDPSWDANYVINSTNLDVTVTGDATNNVLWNITTIVQHVSQG